ncbi:MAG: flagellar filament capping protein FliD [Halothiobacillaceae bacterium]|nr:flagellar filament capping protein FliD [Halothiobacillaceae bacterium]
MAITASGLGSGLDINALVSSLVQAEGAPKSNQLDRQKSAADTKLSAYGTLKSALSTFQTAAKALKDASAFQTKAATSSNDTQLGVSASSSAAAGSYSIEVVQMAQAQKLNSVGFAGATEVVGTGTLNITAGSTNFSITVDSSNNTLAGIRDAINNATGNSGVSATIVNVDDGLGGTESRLVLSSTQPGSSNAITVTATDDDGNSTDTSGLSRLVYDPNGSGVTNLTQQTAAQDALIRVDGMNVTRSSNVISDAIDGVTLTLKPDGVGKTNEITVSTDQEAVKKALTTFVDAYNKLDTTLKSLGKYDASTKSGGPLVGDSILRNVQNQIRADLRTTVGSNTDFDTLYEVGIEIDRNGVMSLDSTRLNAALEDNYSAVSSFFSGTDGMGTRLSNRIDEYLQTGGVLSKQTDRLNDTLRSIEDQRVALDDRLASLEKRLLKQFTAMDVAVAQFNNTGAYLTQQLAKLPGFG